METPAQRLFLTNLDDGIIVNDGDDDLRSALTPEQIRKCDQVAGRMLHLMQPGDGIIMYRDDPSYLSYFEELYGFRPIVFTPEDVEGEGLMTRIMRDTQMLEGLQRQSWSGVYPFIGHPNLVPFQGRVGLRNAWYDDQFLSWNQAGELNDKAEFVITCAQLGIPVPPSVIVSGADGVLSQVSLQLAEHPLIVRLARGAGGLGNAIVNDWADQRGWMQLKTILKPFRGLVKPPRFVVSELMQILYSPSTVVYIPDGQSEPKIVTESLQDLKGSAFVGALLPWGVPEPIARKLRAYALRYARHVQSKGGYGYHNIDWIVTEDESVFAIESNFRICGTSFPHMIAQRLAPGSAIASYDALKVDADTTLADAQAFMRARALAFDSVSKRGIVIVVPPTAGSMAFVALAPTLPEAMELRAQMCLFGTIT